MLAPTRAAAAVVLAIVLAMASGASADEAWVTTTSPHFTVVSNAGQRKASDVAWQLEQIRGAIQQLWPWARIDLNRPVVALALKDEASMRALVPQYWSQGSVHPASVFFSAPDKHYIVLRTDLPERDGVNPHAQAYWSYAALVVESSFNRGLPLWLTTGIGAVVSNTMVSDSEIEFGRAVPAYVRDMNRHSPMPLAQLLAMGREDAAYKEQATHAQYVAQCWGLVHYLLLAPASESGSKAPVNALIKLLLEGAPSAEAVVRVFGSVDNLDAKYREYVKKDTFRFSRLPLDSKVVAKDFPSVAGGADAAVARAGVHAAAGRETEARRELAAIGEGNSALASVQEVEGLLAERARNSAAAEAAFAKAAELGSTNFYTYYRLGELRNRDRDPATAAEVQKRLAKALDLNDRYAPAYFLLAGLLLQNQPQNAVRLAERAVSLAPMVFGYRLLLARVYARLARTTEAADMAQSAREFARTEAERQALDGFVRSLPTATGATAAPPKEIKPGIVGGLPGGVAGGVGQSPPPPSPPPPPPPVPVRVGGEIAAPTKRKDVRPVYPPIAQSARVQGMVIVEATIGPQGNVTDAKILRSIPLLDQAALDAVKQWEFMPSHLNGVAVPVIMTVTVNFTLAGSTPAVKGLTLASSRCAVSDDPSYGYSQADPVRVGAGTARVPDLTREDRFMIALRGPSGEGLTYTRTKRIVAADGAALDVYSVTYSGHPEAIELFIDGVHWSAPKAPRGLLCGAPIELAPPPAGSPVR